MAQTGFTPLKIYASSTAGNTPSASKLINDTSGSELAINIYDGKLFYKDNTGTVQVIATKTSAAGVFTNLSVSGVLSVTGLSSLNGGGTSTTPSSSDNSTKIATTSFVQTALSTVSSVVTGVIQMWSTTTAPSGYLLCNGAAVSRTTYAALFAVVGTTFGVGDGSTTFNLPNYTNRMPYGTTIGATGGSADAVVVSHTHTFSGTTGGMNASNPHTHQAGGQQLPGFGFSGGAGDAYSAYGSTTTSAVDINHGHAYSGTTAATGNAATNANLPPYLGINFIIKT